MCLSIFNCLDDLLLWSIFDIIATYSLSCSPSLNRIRLTSVWYAPLQSRWNSCSVHLHTSQFKWVFFSLMNQFNLQVLCKSCYFANIYDWSENVFHRLSLPEWNQIMMFWLNARCISSPFAWFHTECEYSAKFHASRWFSELAWMKAFHAADFHKSTDNSVWLHVYSCSKTIQMEISILHFINVQWNLMRIPMKLKERVWEGGKQV